MKNLGLANDTKAISNKYANIILKNTPSQESRTKVLSSKSQWPLHINHEHLFLGNLKHNKVFPMTQMLHNTNMFYITFDKIILQTFL